MSEVIQNNKVHHSKKRKAPKNEELISVSQGLLYYFNKRGRKVSNFFAFSCWMRSYKKVSHLKFSEFKEYYTLYRMYDGIDERSILHNIAQTKRDFAEIAVKYNLGKFTRIGEEVYFKFYGIDKLSKQAGLDNSYKFRIKPNNVLLHLFGAEIQFQIQAQKFKEQELFILNNLPQELRGEYLSYLKNLRVQKEISKCSIKTIRSEDRVKLKLVTKRFVKKIKLKYSEQEDKGNQLSLESISSLTGLSVASCRTNLFKLRDLKGVSLQLGQRILSYQRITSFNENELPLNEVEDVKDSMIWQGDKAALLKIKENVVKINKDGITSSIIRRHIMGRGVVVKRITPGTKKNHTFFKFRECNRISFNCDYIKSKEN